jgi:hypothetical protein
MMGIADNFKMELWSYLLLQPGRSSSIGKSDRETALLRQSGCDHSSFHPYAPKLLLCGSRIGVIKSGRKKTRN